MHDNTRKTTLAGIIAGAAVALGQPIVNTFSFGLDGFIRSLSLKDIIMGVCLALLGIWAQGTRKEG